jgi:uncharacterized protein (TIGR02597 family)
MKASLPILIGAGIALRFAVPAEAATAAAKAAPVTLPTVPSSTVPVVVASEVAGFTTLNVAGAAPDKPQLSLDGIGLVNHLVCQGTASTVSGHTLLDKKAIWADNQFNAPVKAKAPPRYYVELTTGPLAGAIFDIIGTSAKHQTLTLAQAIPRSAGKSPGYCVRPHWTLASLFGSANDAGFQSGDDTDSDFISIHNGKIEDKYYYSGTGADGIGWRRVGAGAADQSAAAIYPDDGIAITRVATAPLSMMITGVLKTSRTLVPVVHGFNYVANVYQAPITLAASHLYTHNPATGLRAGGNAATSDTVLIYNGTGYDKYYYQSSVKNGAGWRSSNDPKADAGNVAIPVGSGFVIHRLASTGFSWIAPVPTQ